MEIVGIKMATESTLSPPAPLDLGRMEMEAKETAKKHIANLLQVHVWLYIACDHWIWHLHIHWFMIKLFMSGTITQLSKLAT